MEKQIRISKLMSEKGLCSRREADEYILKGLVYVDGRKVLMLGTKINPNQTIELKKTFEEKKLTIIINKPLGYVSNQPEAKQIPAIRLVTPDNYYSTKPKSRKILPQTIKGFAPAGRLDINSTGLLILTQDGVLAKRIIGEFSKIEKEYIVRIEGKVTKHKLKSLSYGLSLDGYTLKPAKIDQLNENLLRFTLTEGKKRQIRRMCKLVDLKVSALKRTRIGEIKLAQLPLKKWRYLRANENI